LTDVLILSAGRRVSLFRAFAAAATERGLSVATADMRPEMSSACQVSGHSFTLPHVRSEEYANALERCCRDNGVRLVIPTIDTELPILADLRPRFAAFGCMLAVSSPEIIAACADKRLTRSFFDRHRLHSPAIFDPGQLAYPLIVKPYDGSLSAGISILHTPEQLTAAHLAEPRNIFCRYLDPSDYQEFTCDAYYDRDGVMRCIVPRLRVEVRGGEVSKGRTVRNNIVEYLKERIGILEGALGCLTIQVMRHRETGEIFLIEVNARFGGGYPLTAGSGATYHAWLIDEHLRNQSVGDFFDDWESDLLMLRYDGEVFVRG
jgi:carbamoyl-phosphate synthase large subunit